MGRASGVFPGRSIVVLDGVRFGKTGRRAGLDGGIKFETRDTKGFLRWALPAASQWLDTVPNGFKGGSTMSGRIAADDTSVAVKNAKVRLDGMNVSGSMSVAPGDRPVVSANLEIDTLDLDRYVAEPSDDEETADAKGTERDCRGASVARSRSDFPVRRLAQSARGQGASLGTREGTDFSTGMDVKNGGLVIRELSVSGLHDTDISVDGRIAWSGGPAAWPFVRQRSTARTPRNLLDVPELRALLPVSRDAAARTLDALAPVRLRVDLESAQNGETATRSTLETERLSRSQRGGPDGGL